MRFGGKDACSRACLPSGFSRRRERGGRSWPILLLAAFCAAQHVWSQQTQAPTETFIQQQRILNETLDEERRRVAPLESILDWQWGGWIDYYLFHIEDGTQSSRVYQRPGFTAWTHLNVDRGAHEAFARVRLEFNYFNPGDEFDRQQDWEGPNFDRAWYQIDVGRAFRLTEPSDPYQLKIRIGRQPVVIGTGYTFDLPVDAVLLDSKLDDFRLRGLFARSIGSYPNVDRSPAVDSHSNRRFYAVEANYEGIEQHVPFVYALWNDDFTDERPTDLYQEYGYTTQYWGFGSRGSIVRNLNYWAEGVLESGHSFGNGNFRRRDYVHAWAWNFGLDWLLAQAMRPRVGFEYMFASGDADRLGSPTSALGGNRGDREDTSFVAFGYRDTGIAAAPLLSNVHVWRLGGSMAPLDCYEFFRDFEVGTNWFLYSKNRSSAAISDFTADRGSAYVGWEMDYFVNWRLMSDLSWTLRWGAFFPGKAYSDRDTRHTIFTGLTWSF